MATPKFEIDDLFANPNSQVVIAFSNTTGQIQVDGADALARNIVVGFTSSDLAIGGANDFNSPFESAKQDQANLVAQKLQSLAASASGMNFKPFSLKTAEQTVYAWTGSTRPSFTIDLIFPALRPDDDVTLKARALYRTVFPNEDDRFGTTTLTAPLEYLARSATATEAGTTGKGQAGTIVVQVGKWFRATSQVMRSVSFTFSKETIESGLPLYAVGSITFEPYRMPTADELDDYFVG